MKNIISLSIVLLIFINTFSAQDAPVKPMERKEKMKERMEVQQIAFLTNKLDLSVEEASRFWPVYNEYTKKRQAIRKEMKTAIEVENLDENQSVKAVENQLAFQDQELTLKKAYYEKFKSILPASKIAKLEPAELEFRNEVVRKLKEHRHKRMNSDR